MKWQIAKTDSEGVRAIKSGPYMIAKQGRAEVTYMLTRADLLHALGWFSTKDEAQEAAEDDQALFGDSK